MFVVESTDGYEWFPEGLFADEQHADLLAGTMTEFPGYDPNAVRVRVVTAEEIAVTTDADGWRIEVSGGN